MMGIKKHFVARPKSIFVELDYSQLEIRILAIASMCPQLIKDLNDNIDLHTVFAAQIHGKKEKDVTPEERRLAKGFSFQLQFGASAKGIASHWNVPRHVVVKFIDSYYGRYPEVKEWQDRNIKHVNEQAEWQGAMSKSSSTSIKSARLPSIWTRDNFYRGGFHLNQVEYEGSKEPTFAATQIKNYPIQGGAADIVLLMLNKIRKMYSTSEYVYAVKEGEILLLGTIHDSFLFEIHQSPPHYIYDLAIKYLKDKLEGVPELIEEVYQLECPVKFPVSVKVGNNWENMHKYDP